VTFLTLGSADLFHGNTVHLVILNIVVEFLVNAVKFITACIVLIIEINLGFAVTVDAPAHAQVGELVYFRHFLDVSVAGLTLLLAYFHVLAVVEVYVVGQVMHFGPLYRTCAIGYAVAIAVGFV